MAEINIEHAVNAPDIRRQWWRKSWMLFRSGSEFGHCVALCIMYFEPKMSRIDRPRMRPILHRVRCTRIRENAIPFGRGICSQSISYNLRKAIQCGMWKYLQAKINIHACMLMLNAMENAALQLNCTAWIIRNKRSIWVLYKIIQSLEGMREITTNTRTSVLFRIGHSVPNHLQQQMPSIINI